MMMFSQRTAALGAATAAALALACTEPMRGRPAAAASATSLRLVVNPSRAPGDDTVRVSLMAFGFGVHPVASYTVRVGFDTLALRFVGEVETNAAATRASNAQSGLLRAAGIALQGFADGQLAMFAFVPRSGSTLLPAITLDVQELHRIDRSDAAAGLSVSHAAVGGGVP